MLQESSERYNAEILAGSLLVNESRKVADLCEDEEKKKAARTGGQNLMSTDLTFLTNEPGHSLLERFNALKSGRDNATKILLRLRAKEVKHYDGFTEEDEEYVKRVIRLLEDGALPKPTTKKIVKDLDVEDQPLKVLGILKKHISNEFFQATHAERNRSMGGPRQVILSSYLVGEKE